MTDMTNDDTKLDVNNTQGLLEYIQRLKAENARLESRSRLGLNFEDTPDENVVRYSTRVPLSVHEPENDVMTDDHGTTHDLIIGDNYPGLLTLLPKYENKVNVIYIDPPYNTGNNDFIYNDRYTNPEDSYKHSKWLSFMEPRLKLAARLLSDDGVIFVSIDDHEQARLKLLMDGIFGERNFIGNIHWRKTRKPSGNTSSSKLFDKQHEYIIVYAKNIPHASFNSKRFNDDELEEKGYSCKDDYFPIRGYYKLTPLWHSNSGSSFAYSASLDYPIQAPDGSVFGIWRNENKPKNRWMSYTWSKKTFDVGNALGFIEMKKDKNGRWSAFRKMYTKVKFNPKTLKIENIPSNIAYTDYYDGATTDTSASTLNDLGLSFPFSKPVKLVKHLIRLHPDKNALILDFFAGSGTTGQAVAELNAEDGGNRHCILITDEGRIVDDPSAVNIARDITYTRLQRVLTGQDWADGREHPSLRQNLRTHHLTDVYTLKHDGINKRATDDIIMDIIDALYHDDHGGSTPVDYTAYLDKDYQSRARSILNSWRNAVQD